jgi:hypothetical protein
MTLPTIFFLLSGCGAHQQDDRHHPLQLLGLQPRLAPVRPRLILRQRDAQEAPREQPGTYHIPNLSSLGRRRLSLPKRHSLIVTSLNVLVSVAVAACAAFKASFFLPGATLSALGLVFTIHSFSSSSSPTSFRNVPLQFSVCFSRTAEANCYEPYKGRTESDVFDKIHSRHAESDILTMTHSSMPNLTFLTKIHSSHAESNVLTPTPSGYAESDVFYHDTFQSC